MVKDMLITLVVGAGFLMMLGKINERDEKLLAMEAAVIKCPLPDRKEIMHVARTKDGIECSYSDWKRGDWNLTRPINRKES